MNPLFEEFKRLENLCNDIYGGQNGVTLYIEDMERKGMRYAFSIADWNSDLDMLKRVRHIRNAMAHDSGPEPDYYETDVSFIKDFHQRILNQTDPLSIAREMSKPKPSQRKQMVEIRATYTGGEEPETHKKSRGLLAFVLIAAFLFILGAIAVVSFAISLFSL